VFGDVQHGTWLHSPTGVGGEPLVDDEKSSTSTATGTATPEHHVRSARGACAVVLSAVTDGRVVRQAAPRACAPASPPDGDVTGALGRGLIGRARAPSEV